MNDILCVQSRAPSLYDEQLQRIRQEKALSEATEPKGLGRGLRSKEAARSEPGDKP